MLSAKAVLRVLPFGFLLLIWSLFSLTSCMGKEKKGDTQASPQKTDSIPSSENSFNPNAQGSIIVDSVFSGALDGKVDLVKAALEQGFSVDHQDPEGRTALMLAAFNGHVEIIRLLLAKGANVNLHDSKDGSTALMFAASGPVTEVVKMLVEAGAEINVPDGNKHFTPLMWAAEEGHIENVKYLLSKGANPGLKDIDAQTAETFSKRFNHTEITKLLQNAASKKK